MTIVTASGGAFWGRPLPVGTAYVVGGRPVTWAEIGREKRDRQARRLAALREVHRWRPVRLWVAYFDQALMGGWHAFVEGLTLHRVWVDRDRKHWIKTLMDLFPQTLFDTWESWKADFAAAHKVRTQDRKPFGVAYLWHRGGDLKGECPR